MVFKGISKRFCLINNVQYHDIGAFWDFFEENFSSKEFVGLGLDWQKDSFEYLIGYIDKDLDFKMDNILKSYPDVTYKEITLPSSGWKEYKGQTSLLSKLYDEIYKDGPLLYEIESFNFDGSCLIKIFR